jgi:hypothetical protein
LSNLKEWKVDLEIPRINLMELQRYLSKGHDLQQVKQKVALFNISIHFATHTINMESLHNMQPCDVNANTIWFLDKFYYMSFVEIFKMKVTRKIYHKKWYCYFVGKLLPLFVIVRKLSLHIVALYLLKRWSIYSTNV